MKKQSIVFLSALVGGVLLSACGDDVTKVTNVTNEVSGMETVASADSLGTCDSASVGKTAFARDEQTVYVCSDSGWIAFSRKSEVAGCVAEILSDSSGYKIVCGEDSVGVIKNGENGKNGEKGDAGENGTSCTVEILSDGTGYKVVCGDDSVGVILNGSGCSLADNGDGIVSQVCGEDTIRLYKAFCGGTPYDPEKAFCFEYSIYSCGERPYDPTREFCREETIYNLCGESSYDPSKEFCDFRDANIYGYVVIGKQTWMAENLNYAYPELVGKDPISFCYGDKSVNCDLYGRLYTWAAAMDTLATGCGAGKMCSENENVRGVCPEGWHMPSDAEWNSLIDYVTANTTGGEDSVVVALKSKIGWKNDGNGSDAFGFNALPGGTYYLNEDSYFGHLSYAVFWTSTEKNASKAKDVLLNTSISVHDEEKSIVVNSVRCVKD